MSLFVLSSKVIMIVIMMMIMIMIVMMYPSVPELEPGTERTEDDLYVTLERPKKKKKERIMEAAM